ncbi:MAG: MYG1 family protein [Candidatus Paceibacterota bacterium]
MTTILTHSARFHADDVYAVATLELLFLKRGEGLPRIVRSRKDDEIQAADIVVDVGGVYDPEKQRFDHHQGGLDPRANGVPYASFGLVWRKYGTELAERERIAEMVDITLVQPIDASDNGVDLHEPLIEGVDVYELDDLVGSFVPAYTESDLDIDRQFRYVVDLAKAHLLRVIGHKKAVEVARETVEEAYQGAEDKRLIELEYPVPWEEVILQYSEPLYVVYPVEVDGEEQWYVRTVPAEKNSFGNRKDLPEAWGGKEGEAFQEVTGLADAVFCHKARFLAGTRSRESALELARRAVEAEEQGEQEE